MDNKNAKQYLKNKAMSKLLNRTHIPIDTPAMSKNILNIDDAIEYFRKKCKERNINNLAISENIHKWFEVSPWHANTKKPAGQLILFTEGIEYQKIIKITHQRYERQEAILRLAESVSLGYLDFPNNKCVVAHLKEEKDGCPCLLQACHYSIGKLGLSVVEAWDDKMISPGSSFIT